MSKYFSEERWKEELKKPTWYFFALKEYKKLMRKVKMGLVDREKLKEEVYNFFERMLKEGNVYLGKEGENHDKEREKIDTVVIHHTQNAPGITKERLNAMHLLRLYATYYANPRYEGEKHLKGKPVYSGHFRGERQVFYAYHWLVRENGNTQKLLKDEEIGWHAGDWETNKRSVSICIDDDLSNKSPSEKQVKEIVKIIKKYPYIKKVLGHREINPKTECPGDKFLGEWKKDILNLLDI